MLRVQRRRGAHPDPVLRAHATAAEIHRRLTHLPPSERDLDAQHISLLFSGFGRDTAECDQPAWADSPVRFFAESDRIPGIADDQGFPVPRDVSNSDYRTARTYRHPFLSNATPQGAMRDWFFKFVNEYRAMQTEPGHTPFYGSDLPDPHAIYMDTEPNICSDTIGNEGPGGGNAVYLLKELASRFHPGQDRDYWHMELPGDPVLHMTFEGRYLADRELFGLPDNVYDPGDHHLLLPGILNPQGGLVTNGSYSAFHPESNRKILRWYAGLCQRAVSRVMQNSVYEIAHAPTAWPNVKCGNWAEARTDGQNDTTGWFMDNDGTVAPPGAQRFESMIFPRTFLDPGPTGAWMVPTSSGRWLAYKTWAFGDVDSPFLYPIGCQGYWGWSNGVYPTDTCDPVHDWVCVCGSTTCPCEARVTSWERDGHRQHNIYASPGPLAGEQLHRFETRHESAMRRDRHNAESIINSQGVGPGDSETGGHEDRLVPWLVEAWTELGGGPGPRDGGRVVDPRDFRDRLAMLRAKNIREALLWTNFNAAPGSDEEQFAANAWNFTADAIEAVYAPWIAGYKRLTGESLPGEDNDDDPARLEYTLRVQGQSRTVRLNATNAEGYTELAVYVEGLADYPTNGFWHYDIHIESSVDSISPAVGYVFAWDWNWNDGEGQWVQVPIRLERDDEIPYGKYFFRAPDHTARAWMRLFPNVGLHQNFVSQDGQMILKLVHTVIGAPANISSKYDLVQVVPFSPTYDPAPSSGCCAIGQGDVNYDGETNIDDLLIYTNNYLNATPAADTNMDDVVNADDLVKFIENYTNDQ